LYHDDVEYAAKRLDSSLVRKSNGNPFYVNHTRKVGKGIFCEGTDLLLNQGADVALEDIDLTPVPLGFFNVAGKMAFACRKPMRKDWKQGLSSNSLILYGADKRDFSFNALVQSIMGLYPSYEEVLSYVRKTRNRSMAFSRDFGVSDKTGSLQLVYRKYPVGEIKGDLAVLNPDKYFLEQHLASAMGK